MCIYPWRYTIVTIEIFTKLWFLHPGAPPPSLSALPPPTHKCIGIHNHFTGKKNRC